ncbi:MAG: hypothetical protein AB1637_04205 [Elusimicrobiota bacterium]
MKNIISKTRKLYFYILAIVLFNFFGCLGSISYYDSKSFENFVNLKAFHLKFIDDFTYSENKQWDESKLIQKCDTGDLKFREALEYENEKLKKDINREKAIKKLYEQFIDDCDTLKKRAKFFSVEVSSDLRKEISDNYTYAIKGETGRLKE